MAITPEQRKQIMADLEQRRSGGKLTRPSATPEGRASDLKAAQAYVEGGRDKTANPSAAAIQRSRDELFKEKHPVLNFLKGVGGAGKALVSTGAEAEKGLLKGVAKFGAKAARTGERALDATVGKLVSPLTGGKTLGEMNQGSAATDVLDSDILESKNAIQGVGSFVGEKVLPAVAAGIATGGTATLGAAFAQGAGVGGVQSLVEAGGTDKSAGETAKSALTGALTGGLFNSAFYGLGKAVKAVADSKGSAFQKELQPKLKGEIKAVQKGFDSFGKTVANTKNLDGDAAYGGTYKDIFSQSKSEIADKGAVARMIASDAPETVSFTRSEAMGDVVDRLGEGHEITPARLKLIERARKMFPSKMTAEELLDARQALDSRIPESAWENEHKAFLADLYTTLRENARKLLNERLGEQFAALNNSIHTAYDVNRLAAEQMARRSLEKVGQSVGGQPVRGFFTKLIDDVIFNPLVTTKIAPAAGAAVGPLAKKAALPAVAGAVAAKDALEDD